MTTERRLAENEITILAQSLRSVKECVSITDLENNILFVNSSFLNTYGYSEDELAGKHISIVRLPNMSPDLGKEIMPATLRGCLSGELWNKEKMEVNSWFIFLQQLYMIKTVIF